MILNYREVTELHWLAFELQLAGSLILVIGYCQMLDITNHVELKRFQYCNIFLLVFSVLSRGFHWFYLTGNLIRIWYTEKRWTFLYVGSFMIFIFSAFNVCCVIVPFSQRYWKFRKKLAEYKALPADANPKRRRASMMELQEAAHLLARNTTDNPVDLFVTRKVERRQTFHAPAPASTSKARTAHSSTFASQSMRH